MVQALGRPVTFVPHLVPLDRGLMATVHVRLRPGTAPEAVVEAFDRAYASAPFVRVTGTTLPEIKDVVHTNFCDIGWVFDADTGRLCVVSVIDNLVKGAAGQALQNANLMHGLDERAGLL
jgi:N-acetyl-gamma-glutamyl-phosphate reductase